MKTEICYDLSYIPKLLYITFLMPARKQTDFHEIFISFRGPFINGDVLQAYVIIYEV